jgi:hypothetical protein
VLYGITYTLLYCYQHNGMDSNEYNITFKIFLHVFFTVFIRCTETFWSPCRSTPSVNLSQCPPVEHIYRIDWHGIEPRSSWWEVAWTVVRPPLVVFPSCGLGCETPCIHKSVSPLSLAAGNNFGKSLASFYRHTRTLARMSKCHLPPSLFLLLWRSTLDANWLQARIGSK